MASGFALIFGSCWKGELRQVLLMDWRPLVLPLEVTPRGHELPGDPRDQPQQLAHRAHCPMHGRHGSV